MKPVIAFDTETHLMKPYHMAPEIICLSYAHEHGTQLLVDKSEIFDWLKKSLSKAAEGCLLLVGHYVAYDMCCVISSFPELQALVWKAYDSDGITCTLNREKLLDIAIGTFGGASAYPLDKLVKDHLRMSLDKSEKSWRLNYSILENQPISQWPEAAIQYAIDDAKATYLLYLQQADRMKNCSYDLPTQFEEARADFALNLASVWGIETDYDYVKKYRHNLVIEIQGYVDTLIDAGLAVKTHNDQGNLFNSFSNTENLPQIRKKIEPLQKAVQTYWRGPGQPPRTNKGKISTSEETLANCDYEPLRDYLAFKRIEKEISTYVKPAMQPIVHSSFYAIGAASDRTSSRNPNLQNPPRKPGIRECYIPRSGHVFLSCDYDSQEIRTLGQVCRSLLGHSRIAERYQQDRYFDPHLEMASIISGIPLEECKQRKKAGDKEIKNYRQQAKAVNFGRPGGMGDERFRNWASWEYGINFTLEECAALKQKWLTLWPEMRDYFAYVSSIIGSGHGTAVIPQSGFVRGGLDFNNCANTFFQTLAAHCTKHAAFAVSKRCYLNRQSALYNSRIVLFIHDELILETPIHSAIEAARELETVMIEAMEDIVPDVPAAASASLMDRWSKKAGDPVYDNEGNLAIYHVEV